MRNSFADSLKSFRTARGLSQQQLAELLYVDRSTVANWESGRRVPNALQITNIASALGIDVGTLMNSASTVSKAPPPPSPSIIVIEDEDIVLKGEVIDIKRTFPAAVVNGFTTASEALEFAKNNTVDIAFSDIEIGRDNGLELCKKLISINPRINVIFLTAFPGYSFDAWDTGASGFILKPVTEEELCNQITKLRFPVRGL